MPLLDIAIAQSAFHNYLGYTRVKLFVNVRVPNYSLLKCDERWASLRISLRNPGNTKVDAVHCAKPHSKFLIKAFATLFESKCQVQSKDGDKENDGLPSVAEALTSNVHIESSSEDLEAVDEREKLRRMRISKANKGNIPWNKGRKHSPETLQRIRERTRLAMQNPKVKMKLATSGHAQSEETREKIALGVRMGWQKRREKLMLQETCLFDWQNLIAEAARKGFLDEEELQWNSYEILNEQLQKEWLDSIEYRKTTARPKGSRRAPKSLEQRRKIAEAIAAKWADPEYRSRVSSGLAKYHGTPEGAERRARKKPSDERQSANTSKKKAINADGPAINEFKIKPQPKLKKRTTPKFKDPFASAKLEMLKSIRAQRAASATNKNEALERAKLLIEEAEKAAKVLEVAAMKSPVAQASLIETRKLIAEAIQSIERVRSRELASQDDVSSVHQNDIKKNVEASLTEDLNQKDQKGVNGVASLQSREGHHQDFNPYKLTILDEMDMNYRPPTNLSGYKLPKLDLESLTNKELKDQHHSEPNGAVRLNGISLPNGAKLENHPEQIPVAAKPVTKKWVRGRLVEVAEGE